MANPNPQAKQAVGTQPGQANTAAGEQQVHQKAQQVAQAHGINFGQIQHLIQLAGQHPEVLQVIQLVEAFRGNPSQLPQLMAKGDKAMVATMVQVQAVNHYVVDAIRMAGQQPSQAVLDLETGIDAWLAKWGPQANQDGNNPAPAPAPSPTPGVENLGPGTGVAAQAGAPPVASAAPDSGRPAQAEGQYRGKGGSTFGQGLT